MRFKSDYSIAPFLVKSMTRYLAILYYISVLNLFISQVSQNDTVPHKASWKHWKKYFGWFSKGREIHHFTYNYNIFCCLDSELSLVAHLVPREL